MRKHGATCDNLLSADVVTADGRVVTASATENAELFWGLRGGGGNFGIVTSFEFQLHPVGPLVLGGPVFYPAADARDVLRFYRDFAAHEPDELTTMLAFLTAPELPFLPEAIHNAPMVAIISCYAGDLDAGEAIVRPIREFGPPAADVLGPMPYGALQTLFDDLSVSGWLHYSKSDYLDELSDDAIETIATIGASIPSPLTVIHLNHYEGAFGRVAPDATAISYREAPFAFSFATTWTDPAETEEQVRWTRASWESLGPYANGRAYVNFMHDARDEQIKRAYGAAYDRLVRLKQEYDPTNIFRLNQNIQPTG